MDPELPGLPGLGREDCRMIVKRRPCSLADSTSTRLKGSFSWLMRRSVLRKTDPDMSVFLSRRPGGVSNLAQHKPRFSHQLQTIGIDVWP